MVEATKPEDRKMREFDQLYITWRTAVQTNHPYFEGNGLQGLANLMVSPNNFELFGREGDMRWISLGFRRFRFCLCDGTACA